MKILFALTAAVVTLTTAHVLAPEAPRCDAGLPGHASRADMPAYQPAPEPPPQVDPRVPSRRPRAPIIERGRALNSFPRTMSGATVQEINQRLYEAGLIVREQMRDVPLDGRQVQRQYADWRAPLYRDVLPRDLPRLVGMPVN